MHVVVMRAHPDDKWRTSRGIKVCAPVYCNSPDDYKLVEILARARIRSGLMNYPLGIDLWGTYTDAVLLNFHHK